MVSGNGVRGGRAAYQRDPGRPDEDFGDSPDRHSSGGCAGRRASEGNRASRHQTGQSHADAARARESSGFRIGEAGEIHAEFRRHAIVDERRDGGGDGGIHESGTGAGPGRGSSLRYFQSGRSALRDGHRAPALQRREFYRNDGAHSASAAGCDGSLQLRGSRRAGANGPEVPGEGSRAAVPIGAGTDGGFEEPGARFGIAEERGRGGWFLERRAAANLGGDRG